MANLEVSLARIGGGVAVGDVVAGKYRVEGLLGEGGMGVVLAARQITLDRLVALKLMPAEAAKDPVVVGRFLREARAAARLTSDHVAKVIDVGTLPSGAPFMVMEHLEGADLGRVLEQRGRLDVPTACDYVAQACHAVHEAHLLGIVHRDLKPENLYLTTAVGGTAMVKVLDFGVSKVLSAAAAALTSTKTAVGSPMYMAPEQMRASRATDARADVWALGVVLYELLTQRCPFEAETLPDLCLKVVHDPPQSIAALRPDLPADLVAVVERCLAKDPAARFADAGELADALAPFAAPTPSIEAPSRPRLHDALGVTVDGFVPTIPAPPNDADASQRTPTVSGTSGLALGSRSRLFVVAAALGVVVLGLLALRRATHAGAVVPPATTMAQPSEPAGSAPVSSTSAPDQPVVLVPPPEPSAPASTGATSATAALGAPRPIPVPRIVPRPVPGQPTPPSAPGKSPDDIPAFR